MANPTSPSAPDIQPHVLTYREVCEAQPVFDNDPYGIGAYYTPARRRCFLANPNIEEDDRAYTVYTVDGVAAGRAMNFLTRFKAGEDVFSAISGSALEVAPPYRHFALGAELLLSNNYRPQKFIIASGISKDAQPLYRKLKYAVIEFPRLVEVRNPYPLLEWKGIGGGLGRAAAKIISPLLKGWGRLSRKNYHPKRTRFAVEKVERVPEWAGRLATEDGHRFMEVHDEKWLQWNLDYHFNDRPENIQSFYTVSLDGQPLGFFMTTERFRERLGPLKNVLLGSIVEWGTANPEILSETDLYKLALHTFGKDVDMVQIATDDADTVKNMKKAGFLHFDTAFIMFKDKKRQFPDAADPANWRVRLGYADVIFG